MSSGVSIMLKQSIRLLTFRQLPLAVQTEDDSEWQESFAQLADRSFSFENHYVQNLSTDDPLKILGTDDLWRQVTEYIRDANSYSATVSMNDETHPALQGIDWLCPESLNADSFLNHDARMMEVEAQFQSANFAWLHIDAEIDQLTADLFSKTVEVAVKWKDEAPEDILIITSLQGNSPDCPAPFESMLYEGRIKVPLWIVATGGSRRVQALTGSHDVAVTIQDAFTEQDGEQPGEGGSVSLLSIVDTEAQDADRTITILGDNIKGVRSRQFFYVEHTETAEAHDSVTRHALYSKPEDVWNVHDVSGEYPDVIDQHSGMLESC